MAVSEVELTYLLLILIMVGAFGGWLLKVAVDQMKADRKREEEAENRRREYEQSCIEQYEETIKEHNRRNLMHSWISEVTGK
jgi:hypothetical protein